MKLDQYSYRKYDMNQDIYSFLKLKYRLNGAVFSFADSIKEIKILYCQYF